MLTHIMPAIHTRTAWDRSPRIQFPAFDIVRLHVSLQAAPAALEAMDQFFPGSIQDEAFIRACADKLRDFGFNQ